MVSEVEGMNPCLDRGRSMGFDHWPKTATIPYQDMMERIVILDCIAIIYTHGIYIYITWYI